MTTSSALILGLVQGFTEFLPISSSGHLVLAQQILGYREAEVLFDVSLHVGSLLAVLIFFRRDIEALMRGAMNLGERITASRKNPAGLRAQERALLLVIIGCIPTALIGALFRKQLEALFSSVTVVCIGLLITGTLLWLTRYAKAKKPRGPMDMRGRDAFVVGLVQGFAIVPGMSRSGSTISTGLLLGIDRDWAARFSFLLFVPAIIGAVLLQVAHNHAELKNMETFPLLVGTITSAIASYAALSFLIRLIRRGGFFMFAPYCWAVGILGLAWGLIYGY